MIVVFTKKDIADYREYMRKSMGDFVDNYSDKDLALLLINDTNAYEQVHLDNVDVEK